MEQVGQILKINRERKNLILSDVSKELKISEEILYKIELDKRHSVCHHCIHHFRVSPDVYLDLLFEDREYTELFKELKTNS